MILSACLAQAQFTSLVIPEEKKQSVKEFFNTLKEIPAIMDEVQSTLQVRCRTEVPPFAKMVSFSFSLSFPPQCPMTLVCMPCALNAADGQHYVT